MGGCVGNRVGDRVGDEVGDAVDGEVDGEADGKEVVGETVGLQVTPVLQQARGQSNATRRCELALVRQQPPLTTKRSHSLFVRSLESAAHS